MNYWWVNQNKTFERAVERGFLWSPKTSKNGKRNPFYENMARVQPGDVVFAFASQRIKAIAIVSGPHQSMERPAEFNKSDNAWSNDGWTVPVDYQLVDAPVVVREHMDRIGPLLPEKYSPLKADGSANEAYLCPVPQEMAQELFALLGLGAEDVDEWQDEAPFTHETRVIEQDKTLTTTEKLQLIRARKGQGIFRSNVRTREATCRVTGTDDQRFLIASHIKPWAASENDERLDGNNGLMLAPHIDRLFDRGFISFQNDGALIVSEKLPASLRKAWGLEQALPPKPFTAAQARYLDHHRTKLLRK